MHWFLLALAIAAEIFATSMLKLSDGFSKLWPTLGSLGAYAISFYLLSQVLKAMNIGVAYAIWSAAGIIVISLIGLMFFGEKIAPIQVAGIILTVAGVALMNMGGNGH